MSTTTSGQGAHILVFPYPAQGHMLPMLDLTHQLALHGLAITILVTPKNLPTLNPLLSTHPSIQTLILPFPNHPSLPPGVENVRDVGNAGNRPIMLALSKLKDPVITWFESHPNPPIALLSDCFLGWTHHWAHQLGIPRIVFFTSGLFFASVADYLWLNRETVRSLEVVNFPGLPGSPSFIEEHLPSVFRRNSGSDPDSELIVDGMIANTSSWLSVFNSFEALEGEYLAHLREKMGQDRVFTVGPLSLAGAVSVGRANPILDSGDGVFSWLDGCPDGSVVYVCFGSQKFLNRAQTEALANGLERSVTRFVWVVKSEGYGWVPEGFEGRVSGRGMLIKGWAPQVPILSHRAVGGFLSHCGWNSVLESMGAGVMILGWPMEGDQYVCARLLVEDLGAAVRVCEGTDAVPDSAELARIIDESMSGESNEKVKAKELRDKAVDAVKSGGSSVRGLDGLVRELAQLQAQKA